MNDRAGDDELLKRGRTLLAREPASARELDAPLRMTEDVVREIRPDSVFPHPADIAATLFDINAACDFLATSVGSPLSAGSDLVAESAMAAETQVFLEHARRVLTKLFEAIGRPAMRRRSGELDAFLNDSLWMLSGTGDAKEMRAAWWESWGNRVGDDIRRLETWADAQDLDHVTALIAGLSRGLAAWQASVVTYAATASRADAKAGEQLHTRRTFGT